MGQTEPRRGERDNQDQSGLHKGKIFAQNTGKCMEEPVGVGLNLGSGKIRWPNWISVDLSNADVNCDLRELPIENGTVDTACAIHVIEHFHHWDAPVLLREWYRILKPGGKLVLELPCMNKVFGLIANSAIQGQTVPRFIWDALWGDQSLGRPEMCHKYGYSTEVLTKLMESVGFTVTEEEPRYHFKFRDMRLVGLK